jgi:antitoxin MazE
MRDSLGAGRESPPRSLLADGTAATAAWEAQLIVATLQVFGIPGGSCCGLLPLTLPVPVRIFFVESDGCGGIPVRTRIQRWGHSLAVRIPKPFAEEARLSEQAEVDLVVVNGKIVLSSAAKRPKRLADLLSRVTRRNLHREVDTGPAVGREVW